MKYAINFVKSNGQYDGAEVDLAYPVNTEEGLIELCNTVLTLKNRHDIYSVYEIAEIDD